MEAWGGGAKCTTANRYAVVDNSPAPVVPYLNGAPLLNVASHVVGGAFIKLTGEALSLDLFSEESRSNTKLLWS